MLGQRGETRSPFHTVEDIRAMLDEADEQGVLDGQVVKGAVEFQDYEARHLMTGRSRVIAVPRGSSLDAALRIARESGYSRFPVYAGDLETIDGVVYARDLYEARDRGGRGDITPLVRPALVVPETKKAKELLAEMRRAGAQQPVRAVASGVCGVRDRGRTRARASRDPPPGRRDRRARALPDDRHPDGGPADRTREDRDGSRRSSGLRP